MQLGVFLNYAKSCNRSCFDFRFSVAGRQLCWRMSTAHPQNGERDEGHESKHNPFWYWR